MLASIFGSIWMGVKTLVQEIIYAVVGEFFIRLVF